MCTTLCLLSIAASALVPASSAALPPAKVLAAQHAGAREGTGQVWRSQVVVKAEVVPGSGDVALWLAVPLDPDASVEVKGLGPAALLRDADQTVVAIAVPRSALLDRERAAGLAVARVQLLTTAPLAAQEQVRLSPPLLRGDAVQRISFAAGDDYSFEADPALEVVRHMTHLRTPEVSLALQHRCDRLLDAGVELPDPTTIYLTAGPRLLEAGGLVGELTSRAHQRQLVGLVVASGGGLLAVFLALAYRLLARAAARESRQRHMQQRFEELDAELQRVDGALQRLDP